MKFSKWKFQLPELYHQYIYDFSLEVKIVLKTGDVTIVSWARFFHILRKNFFSSIKYEYWGTKKFR